MSTNPTTARLTVTFPETSSTTQDNEWCLVEVDGEQRRVRFHDYDEIYAIPGLYEELFHRCLECASPEVPVRPRRLKHEGGRIEPAVGGALRRRQVGIAQLVRPDGHLRRGAAGRKGGPRRIRPGP